MICFPLDNTEYEANALGAWCSTRTRGVFAADGHYTVTATGGMTVTVSPGLAWLKAGDYWGVNAFEANPQRLTIDTADGALSRIDAVCIRLDKNRNLGEIVIKKGAYSPQPPTIAAPVRNSDYDEIYVATIMVRAGTTVIGPDDITDQRLNEAYCGIMRDGVTSIPTQQLYDEWMRWLNDLNYDTKKIEAQLTEWVSRFESSSESEFNEWFEAVKDQVNKIQAVNLQKQIDRHTAILNGIGGEGESATVVAYVTEAIAALHMGDYAKAADLTALAARVTTLDEKAHTHSNKALLDTYTQTNADLADAVGKKHSHANAGELNKIVSGDKAKWDAAASAINSTIRFVEDPNYPGCYYHNVGNVREWLSPPMDAGVEYRTTERWLGRPVYTKIINGGLSAESKRINYTSVNVIRYGGQVGTYAFLNSQVPNSSATAWYVYACVTNDHATISVGSSQYGKQIYLQIWYTK